MSTSPAAPPVRTLARPGRVRAEDVDRHVGRRMRERRVALGLTQQDMAELIGVTYQQAHKYEKGANRVAAGRLLQVARTLGVEAGYFFEGLGGGGDGAGFRPSPQQRMLLELARAFVAMPRKHQEALCGLARVLSNDAGRGEPRGEDEEAAPDGRFHGGAGLLGREPLAMAG